MSSAWGLSRPAPVGAGEVETQEKRTGPALPPKAARAAHRGIVWLHLAAIAVWLLTALLLGGLALAGKMVPPVLIIAGFGAAAGHGLFLLVHWVLALAAGRRARAASPVSQK